MNDYIKSMRNLIGNETLLTVGCGAIIEDKHKRILLQHRAGTNQWGIPGGLMELGETFEQTVTREVLEETNLQIDELELFGIYSGINGFAQYSNGDKVFSIQLVFNVKAYSGTLIMNHESSELSYFEKDDLPKNINPHQAPFIEDWVRKETTPIIR
ncbi:NUDIX domain-containing protein [Bacillus sp. MCCB 382]|uniref:NUDIX hydrolase n=1 Tax=Bacillus sp. MCCB 382 TaxID=2860197 RepID=UPI001C59D7C3|nr:NUDIX domain-containing protein [Bacillus sp. MCCB 382]